MKTKKTAHAKHSASRETIVDHGGFLLSLFAPNHPDAVHHITANDVTEVDAHEFVTEASDLGWPVGKFLRVIKTDIGNGLPFMLVGGTPDKMEYMQANGCTSLTIFND